MRREARRAFDADEKRLVEVARRVLDEGRIYRDTKQDGLTLTTLVKPNPFYLGTAMRVRVRPDEGAMGAGSLVQVTSVSQPFIHADPHGFYDRFVRGFLDALGRRLEDPDSRDAEPQEQGYLWPSGTSRGRSLIVAGLVVAFALVVLPAVLTIAGLGGIALAVVFFPFAAAAGYGLARCSAPVRRRFGMVAAGLAAVTGFASLCAIFIAVGAFVSEALIPGQSASMSTVGSGLVCGIFVATISWIKPDGFDGAVSAERDVRGPRGYLGGIGRALLSGPMLHGNPAMMGVTWAGGLLLTAFGVFASIRGGVSPVAFFVMLLGLGNLLLGVAETVWLGPPRVNAVMRVAGLIAFPVLLIGLA